MFMLYTVDLNLCTHNKIIITLHCNYINSQNKSSNFKVVILYWTNKHAC